MKNKKRVLSYVTVIALVFSLLLSNGLSALASEADAPEETVTAEVEQPAQSPEPAPQTEPLSPPAEPTEPTEPTVEPSLDTLSPQPAQALYNLETAWAVTFKDNALFGDTVLLEQEVRDGESAVAPEDPIHEGYTFTGWEPATLENITAETTFVAQYEELVKYTVTITYVINDETVDPQLVPEAKILEVTPGESQIIQVESPFVKGYLPSQKVVEVDTAQVSADEEITVTYEPTDLVPYKVKHFLADLTQPENPAKAELAYTEELEGKIEEQVTAVAQNFEGFSAPSPMPSGTIPADDGGEPFELHVYYTRNEFTLRFISVEEDVEKQLHTIQLPFQSEIGESQKPEEPSRIGYVFDGWMLDGEKAEIPAAMPAENLTFEAKWETSAKAEFTLECYLQDPNDWNKYDDFVGSYTLEGQVGKAPVVEVTDAAKALAFKPEFLPNSWDSFFLLNEEKTNEANQDILVKNDGTTVVKVYFDRKTFQFKLRVSPKAEQDSYGNLVKYDDTFDFNCKNGQHASGAEVCFEGKFGQNVTDKMYGVKPIPTDNTSAEQKAIKLDGWRIISADEGQVYGTGIGLPNEYIVTINWLRDAKEYAKGGVYYVDAVPKSDPIVVAFPGERKIEQLDGSFDTEGFTRNLSLTGLRMGTGTDQDKIVGWTGYGSWSVGKREGFTAYYEPQKVTGMSWTNCWMTQYKLQKPLTLDEYKALTAEQIKALAKGQKGIAAKFPESPVYQTVYFMRNSYPLTVANVGNAQSLNLLYEQKLADGLKDFVPEVLPGYSGYQFDGWYTDLELTQKANLEAEMPASSMTLYAKWKRCEFSVNFDLDGGMLNENAVPPASQTVLYGDLAQEPDGTFTKAGFIFDGWMLGGTGSKFSFGTEVTGNMTLNAKWKPRMDISYTVQYRVSGQSEPWKVITGTDGEMGGSIMEKAEFYKEGYYPDTLSKWRRLTHKGEDNVIVFDYTKLDSVEYTVFCLDTTGKLLSRETKSSGNVMVTENCKAIEGYTAQKSQDTLMLTSNPSLNVIRFIYNENRPAAYKVVHYQQKADKSGYEEALSEDASARVGVTVRAEAQSFDGFKYNASLSRSWDTVKADGSTVLKLYYDRTEAASSSTSAAPPVVPPVDPPASSSEGPSSAAPSRPASSRPASSGSSSRPASSGSSSSSAPAISAGPVASGGGGGAGGGTPADAAGGTAPVADPQGGFDAAQAAALPPLVGLNQEETAKAQRQTGNPISDLLEGNVPLGGLSVSGSWSFASLLFALFALAVAAMSGVSSLLRRKKGQRLKGITTALALVGAIASLLSPLLWLALDNLNTPMTWINQTTPLIGLVTVLGVVATLVGRVISRAGNSHDDDGDSEYWSSGGAIQAVK